MLWHCSKFVVMNMNVHILLEPVIGHIHDSTSCGTWLQPPILIKSFITIFIYGSLFSSPKKRSISSRVSHLEAISRTHIQLNIFINKYSQISVHLETNIFSLYVEFPKPSCIETTEIKHGFICNFTIHPLGLIGFHYRVG